MKKQSICVDLPIDEETEEEAQGDKEGQDKKKKAGLKKQRDDYGKRPEQDANLSVCYSQSGEEESA